MSPSNEDITRQDRHDDANPFVAFRRFADEQMSALLNGVLNVSSAFGSPSKAAQRSSQDYETWLQHARDSSHRLAREADEAGRIMEVYARAHNEEKVSAPEKIRAPPSDDDSDSLRCPYRPAGQEVPKLEGPHSDCLVDDTARSALSLATLGVHLPPTILAAQMLGEQIPSVPVSYLLYSPYSPVRLEHQRHLCDHGAMWREAFEDLLAAQTGQELPPKGRRRISESGVDWVKGMIGMAMCKREQDTQDSSQASRSVSQAVQEDTGLLSRFACARQLRDDAEEEEDIAYRDLDEFDDGEVTELDIYDRFFGLRQSPPTDATSSRAPDSAQSPHDLGSPKTCDDQSGILSTLTTTERTILRDGSVHTKMVLKRRFSDGREESTETVHHQNALQQPQTQSTNKVDKKDHGQNEADKDAVENKSRGWFWS